MACTNEQDGKKIPVNLALNLIKTLNKKRLSYLFTVLLLAVTIYTLVPKKKEQALSHFTGLTMGSIGYNVKVVGDYNFQHQVDSILVVFNQSLSTYIPDSEISTFNKIGGVDDPSRLFQEVLATSFEVYEKTNGAFDPTVGPLINAWGFGPDKKVIVPDSTKVDSLLLLIGLEKVDRLENAVSHDAGVYLDFSAIAKGQAVDEVGKFLEEKGIENYMVEIGGEVRCRGRNQFDKVWRIGIQDPRFAGADEKMAIADMENKSLATSGNYRNYYEKDGKIYAHIVDPRTGYTANHNLLSASVFAADCMTADAYATAFMVLGLEESIKIVEADKKLEAVFIFQAEEQLDIYESTGISTQIQILKNQ